MSVDLRFVDDVGCGDKCINVVVCIERDSCCINGASTSLFNEFGIDLDEKIYLIVV
jgi:hypothetical protein